MTETEPIDIDLPSARLGANVMEHLYADHSARLEQLRANLSTPINDGELQSVLEELEQESLISYEHGRWFIEESDSHFDYLVAELYEEEDFSIPHDELDQYEVLRRLVIVAYDIDEESPQVSSWRVKAFNELFKKLFA